MNLAPAILVIVKTAAMSALGARIDAGGPGAVLALYATARPAPGGAAGASALVSIPLADPCGTAAAGALTLTDTAYAQIITSGTVVWARITDGAGAWVGDFSVGTPAMYAADPATAEVVIVNLALYAGAMMALVGAQIVVN